MNNSTLKHSDLFFGINNYKDRENSINIATEKITSEEPGWLIDNKTMNLLMSMLVPSSLEDIKKRLTNNIELAKDVDNISHIMEEFLAIQKLMKHPNLVAWNAIQEQDRANESALENLLEEQYNEL